MMFSALPQQQQMDMLSRQFTGQRNLFLGDDPAGNETRSSTTEKALDDPGKAVFIINSEPGGGKKEPIPLGAKKESIKPFMAYP